MFFQWSRFAVLTAVGMACGTVEAQMTPHVPGTGALSSYQHDDFEGETWKFNYNMPKSSREQDENVRGPLGYSNNKKWREGPKRGTPDQVIRVPTPAGGLPGSNFAMALKTKSAGIPGRLTYEQQQDDLLLATRAVPVSWKPSCVVRIYLPPFEEWEDRTGSHFGIRADLRTTIVENQADEPQQKRGGLFGRLFRTGAVETVEPYWPGMFIQFNSKTDGKNERDSAMIVIRGDVRGNVMPGPMIHESGWWTFGMSITPDGAVHYFARKGVEDLRPEDLITSQFPYGYKAETFTTMFFNSVTMDDGKTWSTEFIIDDPAIYFAGGSSQQATSNSGNTRR